MTARATSLSPRLIGGLQSVALICRIMSEVPQTGRVARLSELALGGHVMAPRGPRVAFVWLEHAKRRLQAVDQLVASIARGCGFGPEGNTRRRFHHVLGNTSQPYRQHSGVEVHGA